MLREKRIRRRPDAGDPAFNVRAGEPPALADAYDALRAMFRGGRISPGDACAVTRRWLTDRVPMHYRTWWEVELSNGGIAITLSLAERDVALRDTVAIEDDILARMRIAEVSSDGIRIWVTPGELDMLIGAVAFEANHADDKKRKKIFDRLFDRLFNTQERLEGRDPFQLFPPFAAGRTPKNILDVAERAGVEAADQIIKQFRGIVESYFNEKSPDWGDLTRHEVDMLCDLGWWGATPLIRLNSDLGSEEFAGSPFLNNARIFLAALRDARGVPATAAGNLSRPFVREMLDRMILDAGFRGEILRYNKVINEKDVWPLHIVRVVCDLAKLTRKFKGRFITTKKAFSLLMEKNAGQLFTQLFTAHLRDFELGYLSRFHYDVRLQILFPYSLYRLRRMETGKEFTIAELPYLLLPEAVTRDLDTANEWTKSDHLVQTHVVHPLRDFGLLAITRGRGPNDKWDRDQTVRKTPLFDRFVELP